MDAALSSLLTLYIFSTGRRLFALTQVRKIAKELAFPELEAHAVLALKHDRSTQQLEHRWSGTPAPAARSANGQTDLQRLDTFVDRTLTALRDAAAAQSADDDIADKVDNFVHAVFPAGVQAVTSLPYVDELAAVDAIVANLKGPLAPLVLELGLTRLTKRLIKLAAEYRAAQEAPAPAALAFDTLRAARAIGQENLLQAVALILGRYYQSTPGHEQARSALLAPILKQNEAIRTYLRARRAVEDVDPDTGEVGPSAAPAAAPAPA